MVTEAVAPKGELKHIPLKKIRENPIALRGVNRKSEKYIGLVDSIRQSGIINPISVREVPGPDGETLYGLVDGLHRFTGATDAGLDSIPAYVTNRSDAEVLEAQIIANAHKVETKPVQYSRQLIRILQQNPTMTEAELAKRLSKSPKWLKDRLGLTNLTEDIGKLVDSGELNLSNAYGLARLPQEEQENFLQRALTDQPNQFLPTIQNRTKEIRDAKRQGRTPGEAQFVANPHLRKLSELKAEFENPTLGPALLKQQGIKTPEEAFQFALRWALSMDPESIEVQKKKDEERKAEEARQRELRKKERLEQKAKEAAEKVANMQPA